MIKKYELEELSENFNDEDSRPGHVSKRLPTNC